MRNVIAAAVVMAALSVCGAGAPVLADGHDDAEHSPEAQDFVHGAPAEPSEAWLLAAGGRIYDNWWDALDREPPDTKHPVYPPSGQQDGSATWRCKECHGWDYQGAQGVYRQGSHYTGIPGILQAQGRDPADIIALLRGVPHGYKPEMISDDEMARLAAFVSRGTFDMSPYIDLATREIIGGDAERGKAVFQTICAACHGFDGRMLDWGGADGPAYVGTEAVAAPDEVMNKILNAHPGAAMANLRAFGPEVAADVLRYAASLPQK